VTDTTVFTQTAILSGKLVPWNKELNNFLRVVHRASRYVCVIKSNLMKYLSSVYFVNQPLHVSSIFLAHHQEVHCIYTTIGTCCGCWL